MFVPWVGADYGNSDNILGGARLLVLGEAHYDPATEIGEERPRLTVEVIESHLAGRLGANALFFTRIERLVTGRYEQGLSSDESASF